MAGVAAFALDPSTTSIDHERMDTVEAPRPSSSDPSAAPNPPVPWATLSLVAANLAVHVAMSVSGANPYFERDLIAWGGSFGPRTFAEPWRLLTANFLHFTTFHLVTNMLWLGAAGAALERLVGHARLGAIFFAACIVGQLGGVAAHPQGASAGASLAVLGVYGALGAVLLRRRDPLPPSSDTPLLVAGVGFLAYVGLSLASSSGFDMGGHLGGLMGGLAAGAWLAPTPGGPRAGIGAARVSLSVIAIAAAALLLLPKPIDLAGPLDHYARTEARLAARAAELGASAREGRLSNAAVIAAIREEVIPSWHELRSVLPDPARLGPRQRELVALLNQQAAVQEELWTLIAADAEPAVVAERAAEVRRLRGELDAHVVRR